MDKTFFEYFKKEYIKNEEHRKIIELCHKSSDLCFEDSAKAIEYASLALDTAEQLTDPGHHNFNILALISVAYAYWYHNNLTVGEAFAQRALDMHNDSYRNHICEGRIWSLLALFAAQKGEWSLALHHFEKAVKTEINECCGENFRMMQLNNLAGVHNHLGDLKASLKIIEEIVEHYKSNKNWLTYCQVLLNKAVVLHKLNDLDNSIFAINEVLDVYINENLSNLEMKGLIYSNLSAVKLDKDQSETAEVEIEESWKVENKIGFSHHHFDLITNTVRSLTRRDRLDEAEKLFKENIQKVQVENCLNYPRLLSAGIILYKKLGDLQTIIDLQNDLLQFKDRNFDQALAEQQAKFNAIYEFEKSENEKEIYRIKNIQLATLNEELSQVNDEVSSQKESLMKLNEQLQNMIATKDRMFSVIAHDVRNPFQNLLTTLESLTEHYDSFSDSEKKKYLFKSNEMVHKLIDFFENLLEWSRIQTDSISAKFIELKLDKIISDVLYFSEDKIKIKELSIIREYDDDIAICGDYHMMHSIIRNLINNAIKFSFPRKKLIIRALKFDDLTEISIIDEGTGISEDNIKKIFDPDIMFSKNGTDKERGFGLGLVLTNEFIKKHNGTIKCISTPGKGTTMKIRIPCCRFMIE